MMDFRTLHNMSSEQIVSEIESLGDDIGAKIESKCMFLTELKTRAFPHRLHKDLIYRHHAAIAAGKILPGLVLACGGDNEYVRRFCNISKDAQQSLLNGRPVLVAVVGKDGIKEARQTLAQMTRKTLARLLPASGGVASVSEQWAALEAEIAVKPKPRARVYSEAGRIVVANSIATLEEIKVALAELGLRVVPDDLAGDNPRSAMLRIARDAYEAGEPSQPPKTGPAKQILTA